MEQKAPQRLASEVISELYSGMTDKQIGQAIREAVTARLTYDKSRASSEVDIKLTFEKVGDENSNLLSIRSKVTYKYPTLTGKRSEDFERTTQMFADKLGNLTLEPAGAKFVPPHQRAKQEA